MSKRNQSRRKDRKQQKQQQNKNDAPKPSQKPTFESEPLEPRVLLSATWVDADTDDVLDGATDGNDHFTGSDARDVADGTAGNDILEGMGGDDTLFGGDGDDTIHGGDGQNTLDGGAGNDQITSRSGDDAITAGEGNDTIDAGHGQDQIHAGAGDDQISAGGGDDTIHTGAGNDHVNAGEGNDLINAGPGNDILNGDAGDDRFVFSNAQNGDRYVVNGGTGTHDRIDLSAYADDQVQITADTITVTDNDGHSFQIEYSNVEHIDVGSEYHPIDTDATPQPDDEPDAGPDAPDSDPTEAVSWFDESNDQQEFAGFSDMVAAYDEFVDDSEQSLTFDNLSEGDKLGEQYAESHGVHFENSAGGQYHKYSGIRTEAGAIAEQITGYDGSYMPHGDNVYVKFDNEFEDTPFTMTFDEPVAEVGAFVGMGVQGDVHALEVSLYDSEGNLVGQETVEAQLWESGDHKQNYETFFAAKSDEANISRVEIRNVATENFANALIIDNIAWSHTVDAPAADTDNLTAGLVAHWSLNDNAGNNASENVSNLKSELKNMDGDEWSDGKVDGGLRFDGVDDYIHVSDDLSPTLGGTATLSAWVQTTQTGDAKSFYSPSIIGNEQSGGTNDLRWGYIDDQGRIGMALGNSDGAVSEDAINDGEWHHVAMTRDADTGEISVFVDGQLSGTAQGQTGLFENSPLHDIGRTNDFNDSKPETAYYEGGLDDVRIYDRALSAEEIAQLAASDSPGAEDLSALVLAGVEDTPLPLDLTASIEQAANESHDLIRISNVPDGATLSVGTDTGGGVWEVARDDVAELTLTPPANSNEPFSLTVAAVDQTANESSFTIDKSSFDDPDQGYTVTAQRINSDGTLSNPDTDNVKPSNSGLGVVGNTGGPANQLGYDADHEVSERLIVEFEGDLNSATVEIERLFANERGTSERGHYQLFNGDELVAEADFDPTNGNATTLNLAAPDGATFNRIEFSATEYADGQGDITHDSSDYCVKSISGSQAFVSEESVQVATVDVTLAAVNDAPVADAGPDQFATEDDGTITLDATASLDADAGDSLQFSWRQTDGPSVQLNDPNAAQPTFSAPNVTEPTALTFEVEVTDGVETTTDTVVIHLDADNDAPEDLALSNNTIADDAQPGTTVGQLSAIDPEGEALTFEIVGGGSTNLSDALTNDPDGVFTTEYNGNDGGKRGTGLRLTSMGRFDDSTGDEQSVWRLRNSNDDVMTIVVQEYGGESRTFELEPHSETFFAADGHGTQILKHDGAQLDVKASGNYAFSSGAQVEGPNPNFAIEADKLVVADNAQLDHDAAPTQSVQVRVTDASGASTIQTFEIDIENGNEAPVANAGPDQIVSEDLELVTLDATNSTDPDAAPDKITFSNDMIESYGTTQNQDKNSEFAIEDNGATLHITGNGWKKIDFNYTVTEDTILEFEFKSNDVGEIHCIGFDNDQGQDASKSFKIAGTQNWGRTIDSTYDGDGDWQKVSIRVGDHYTGDFDRLLFINDQDAGDRDCESFFRNVRVFEHSADNASNEQLTYNWTQTHGPAVQLSDPHAGQPTFAPPNVSEPTTLTFEVQVSDGDLTSTDTVQITVNPANHGPVADAGTDQIVDEGATVTLNATASTDPDAEDTLTYAWTQVAGPSVQLSDSAAAEPEFVAPDITEPTVLRFEFNVSDGDATTTDTVEITVNPVAETPPVEQPPADEPTAQEPQSNEPVVDPPLDEPVDQPVDEPPANETPANEPPADETPVDEAPVTPAVPTPSHEPVAEQPASEPAAAPPASEPRAEQSVINEQPIDAAPQNSAPPDDTLTDTMPPAPAAPTATPEPQPADPQPLNQQPAEPQDDLRAAGWDGTEDLQVLTPDNQNADDDSSFETGLDDVIDPGETLEPSELNDPAFGLPNNDDDPLDIGLEPVGDLNVEYPSDGAQTLNLPAEARDGRFEDVFKVIDTQVDPPADTSQDPLNIDIALPRDATDPSGNLADRDPNAAENDNHNSPVDPPRQSLGGTNAPANQRELEPEPELAASGAAEKSGFLASLWGLIRGGAAAKRDAEDKRKS